MTSNIVIQEYLSAGKRLTPLKGKIPKLKKWTIQEVSDEKILSHNGNIGMVIQDGFLVLDVDPKNGGEKSFEKLQDLLSKDLIPTVETPSGGRHYYMTLPNEFKSVSFRKTLEKEFKGIDFLTTGSQCVIVSSSTNKKLYEWTNGGLKEHEAPIELLEIYAKDYRSDPNISDLGDFEGLISGSSSWTDQQVLDLLSKLDPSMPNDEWVRVGMALHDHDPIDGLLMWEEWSINGDNYTEDETEKRWQSFDSGGGVTLGTISYMAKEADFDEQQGILTSFIDRINKANEKEISLNIIADIKKVGLDLGPHERLASVLQNRLKDLTGIRPSIKSCRDMLSIPMLVRDEDTPAWCNEWVYVNSHRGYVDFKKLQVHKAEAFNLINTKYVSPGPRGGTMYATQFASLTGLIKSVDTMGYLPMYEDRICNIDGRTILNTFNSRTIPITAEDYTDDGVEAIEMVKRHIKFICSSDENSSLLTQWLAHQIQYPGRQVLWSPVIQSIPGTGKSFFAELLRNVLGDRNIGTVSSSQVTSNFNAWATNVVVNVLEELRVQGHNRYEAVNSLKPLITDRIIQINDKGVTPYRTLNTSNYICFTNHKDALPLDDNDRRWWVIFVPISSLVDIELHVGEEAKTYFPRLFSGTKNHAGEIRKWFLEYKISKEFMSIKQAPMTDHKELMVATEDAAFEGLTETRDLINIGGPYFVEGCLSSSDIFEVLVYEHPDLELNNTQKNRILRRLGYTSLPKKVKIDGKTKRIWVLEPMDNNDIRQTLSKGS